MDVRFPAPAQITAIHTACGFSTTLQIATRISSASRSRGRLAQRIKLFFPEVNLDLFHLRAARNAPPAGLWAAGLHNLHALGKCIHSRAPQRLTLRPSCAP